MIRDKKMMQLVASEKEPITPFVHVIASLRSQGVSTILVIGGTGDFFHAADQVIVMDCYRAVDATARAKLIVDEDPTVIPQANFTFPAAVRSPIAKLLDPQGKTKVLARNVITFGDTEIDLSAQEQIVSENQANAIASALKKISQKNIGPGDSLKSTLLGYSDAVDRSGLDFVAPGEFNGSFMRPRIYEVGAAINRLRRDCIKKC
jgi:predicted ABC-class ATPase